VLEPSRRPLTAAQKRLLRARTHGLAAPSRRLSRSTLLVGGATLAALWLWTLVASDASWATVCAFWLVAGGAIMWWVRREMRGDQRQLDAIVLGLESALRRNIADVYDVRAIAFAELEEIEDEGACFPSLDFSLVHVLDEHGPAVDMLIDKRGATVAPARTIPAAVKRALVVPDHLEVRRGTLADLETILR
jgi:hypothetical protein